MAAWGTPGTAGRLLRHPLDREIARLAVPALGALAAEPLYILADTAVIGHLGTPQLGGLAVAGTVLAFWLFNFLGAGDLRFLARAMLGALVACAPVAWAVGVLDLSLPALWGALALLMAVRLAAVAWRFAGSSWAVTGPGC